MSICQVLARTPRDGERYTLSAWVRPLAAPVSGSVVLWELGDLGAGGSQENAQAAFGSAVGGVSTNGFIEHRVSMCARNRANTTLRPEVYVYTAGKPVMVDKVELNVTQDPSCVTPPPGPSLPAPVPSPGSCPGRNTPRRGDRSVGVVRL